MKAIFTRALGNPPGFSWLVPGFVLIVAMASLIGASGPAQSAAHGASADWAPPTNFAVLAGSTVTSTGPSHN